MTDVVTQHGNAAKVGSTAWRIPGSADGRASPMLGFSALTEAPTFGEAMALRHDECEGAGSISAAATVLERSSPRRHNRIISCVELQQQARLRE